MKILHYSLGFPPYRSGGLTKYCTDLMITQKEQGHDVGLLWPGQMGVINKKTKIRKGENWNEISNFELVNPLPIALDEGVIDINAYTQTVDKLVYIQFLENNSPEVIHIHTLMGLHKEFIMAANDLNIRTVFTSHDYYGLCPKVTFFRDGKTCDDDNNCADCVQCNQSALSLKKIMIMQSPLYRKFKNVPIVKKLRQKHRSEFFEEDENMVSSSQLGNVRIGKEYKMLRGYYISMLQVMDMIHYNSSVAKKVYERHIHPRESQIVTITHRDVKDCRKIKVFNSEKLRITYLGPAKEYKGFNILIKVLDELWKDGNREFELHIYSKTKLQRPYISIRQENYPYNQLSDIFVKTDIMIALSLWYETFGLTVLEALGYGVPVMVSENVGAKDLLFENKYGIITSLEIESIKESLCKLCNNHNPLKIFNNEIMSSNGMVTMTNHNLAIMELYHN